MDQIDSVGRQLPYLVCLPWIALISIGLAILVRKIPSSAARFVILAIWLRCVLAALHDISFSSSPLGLSYNALASVMVSGFGLFVIRKRGPLDPGIVPFIPIFLIIVVSGIANNAASPMASVISKFGYLIVLALAVEDALTDLGIARLSRLLMWPFAIPLGLQFLSIVMGVAKPGEQDGAASYIGGFYHEAAFSVTLMAAMLLVCLNFHMKLGRRFMLLMLCAAGVIMANYRTAILAMAPLIGIALFLAVPRRFIIRQQIIVSGIMLLLVGAGAAIAGFAAQDRFADLAIVANQGTDIIQRPGQLSTEDRRLMSGRPAIWSGYIYAWKDADPVTKLIGFGAETWVTRFKLYAHNTLVSALYEIGVLGVAAYLFLWVWMFGLAICVRNRGRSELIAAHLTFLTLNMATMPMWMIEGMIFYGLVCGYTLYQFKSTRTLRRPSKQLRFSEPTAKAVS